MTETFKLIKSMMPYRFMGLNRFLNANLISYGTCKLSRNIDILDTIDFNWIFKESPTHYV